MEKKMSIMGVAPKLAVVTAVALAAAIILGGLLAPFGAFPQSWRTVLMVIGIVLMAVGLTIHGLSAHMLLSIVKKRALLTGGPYALFLNPMYASAILFTVPGLALILNSWLVLLVPVAMFIAHKSFIRGEEDYLKASYGRAYEEYAKKVPIKL